MSEENRGWKILVPSVAALILLVAACERSSPPTAPAQPEKAGLRALAERLYDAKASRDERNQCWEQLRSVIGRSGHKRDAGRASAALTEALRSDSSALRRAALLALESELGLSELRSQREPLAELLQSSAKRSGPAPEGPAALRILARLGPELRPICDAIQSCLDLDPQGAIRCLMLMGKAAEPARAALEARLLSADRKLRQLCHEALLGLTPPGISAGGLEKILETIRGGAAAGDLLSALQSLSELSSMEQSEHRDALNSIVPILVSRMGDRSEAVLVASCGALACCPPQPDALKSLAQLARHKDGSVRFAALRALFSLESWQELASALEDRISQDEVAALLPLLPKDAPGLAHSALDLILSKRAEAALRKAFKDLIRVSPAIVGEAISLRWREPAQREALASLLLLIPAQFVADPILDALNSSSPRLQMAALQALITSSAERRPSVSIAALRDLARSSSSDVQRLALRALTRIDTSLEQASEVAGRLAIALEAALSGDGASLKLVELRQHIIALSEIQPEALQPNADAILGLAARDLPSEDPYITKLFLQLAASTRLSSEQALRLLEYSSRRLGSEDQAASRLHCLQILGELASARSDLLLKALAELKRNAKAGFAPGRLVAIQQLGRLGALTELLELLPQVQANERGACWKAISEATAKSTATSPIIYQNIKNAILRGIEAAEAGPALSALARSAPPEATSELINALKARLGGPTWSAALAALRGLSSRLDFKGLAAEAIAAASKGEATALRLFCIEGFSPEARAQAVSAAWKLIQSESTKQESLPPAFQVLNCAPREGDIAELLKLALSGSPPRDALAAQALRECQGPASVAPLCQLLAEGPAAYRAAAALALAEPRGLDPSESKRLEALKRAAMLSGEGHSEAALSALLQLAPQSNEAGQALDFWLASAIPARLELGLRALSEHAVPKSPLRLALVRQIGERYGHLRELALEALTSLQDPRRAG